MIKDTKALVHAANFEPIMHLIPKRSANDILEQALTKRWWDTTHAFHIARKELTVTPHDFHRITDLRTDRPIINMESGLFNLWRRPTRA